MKILTRISAVSLLIIASSVQAQTAQEQLDSRLRAATAILDARLAKESVPGAALGVVHDQELVWSYQYGVESYDTKRPVTDDTVFSICSVSKLFNGIAAMSLVEDGKLDLDASIFDYIDNAAPTNETNAEEPATLRNILSHVSGLPREGVEDFWADNAFPTVAALRDSSSKHDQLYQPYEHLQYSNLGMSLVGDAIAITSGQNWGQFVDEVILSPLGMNNTTTDMPFDKVGKGFARGYFVRDAKGQRKPVPSHQFLAYAPAAGIASSVNDMARFAAWNFRLREQGGEEILKATTLKQMQRVHWVGQDFDDPAWGLAFATRRYGDDTMWGHGGYCPGARTEFVMRVPDETAYIMMVTANDVSPSSFVRMMYDFVNTNVTAVYGEDEDADATAGNTEEATNATVDLAEYEGYYAVENYDWDNYIGIGDGELFSIAVFSNAAVKNIETLVHVEGDTFYRKRDDDSRGEPVVFERDADGKVNAVVQHSYRSKKR